MCVKSKPGGDPLHNHHLVPLKRPPTAMRSGMQPVGICACQQNSNTTIDLLSTSLVVPDLNKISTGSIFLFLFFLFSFYFLFFQKGWRLSAFPSKGFWRRWEDRKGIKNWKWASTPTPSPPIHSASLPYSFSLTDLRFNVSTYLSKEKFEAFLGLIFSCLTCFPSILFPERLRNLPPWAIFFSLCRVWVEGRGVFL